MAGMIELKAQLGAEDASSVVSKTTSFSDQQHLDRVKNRQMALEVVTNNVLDEPADGILLAVDGAKRGMEGNIARQFARRYPDDWEDLQRNGVVPYPIPLGRSVAVPWDGDCPWQLILFSSTLNHRETLDDGQKRGVMRTSLSEALRLCVRYGISSLATAVLQGGWRLSATDALQEMQAAYRGAGCPQVRLIVCQRVADLPAAAQDEDGQT